MNEIRRQSHNKRANPRSLSRMAWMVFIVVLIIVYFVYKINQHPNGGWSKEPIVKNKYEPDAKEGKVYEKPFFSLSYVEKYELPEWVTYQLTVDMLNHHKFPRTQDFNPDPAITSGSGHYHDYKSSDYRRGHLVPAGDMSWNKAAMDATFLLSNIAPMKEEFNDGIWNELEQDVRDWARKYKEVIVVAGPVFKDPITSIGANDILVPRYFYKAVFTTEDNHPRVIGFVFDQTKTAPGELQEYVVPIDSIEKMTGLDLFANLYGNWDTEITLEKNKSSMREWPANERWYEERVNGKR